MTIVSTINGTPGNDSLFGDRTNPATGFLIPNDIISGLDGDDSLDGGNNGNDVLYGGEGNDTLILNNLQFGVSAYGDNGDDTFFVGGVPSSISTNTTLADGGAGNDTAIMRVTQALDVVIDLLNGFAFARRAAGAIDTSRLFSAKLLNIENVIGEVARFICTAPRDC